MSKLDDEYPISRINVDDEERKVPKGEYRYALNVRNGTPYIKKGGVATNVKGNVIVPTYLCPYNGGSFPDGRNKTIGAYEDTIKDSIVFFNWNSKGKHGIYRWYKEKKDSNNPYGIVEQIIQYDFGWKQNERITSINYVVSTSGDLVYWIDSTGLRKINIDRANINDKIKSWNFYYPKTNPFTVASIFQFKLFNVAGNLIVDIRFNLGTYANTNDGIAVIATLINDNYGDFVVAEACNCQLTLKEKEATSFNYQYLGRPQFGLNPFPCLVVPDNWYGTSLVDRMFDRVPYPPLNPPIAEYRKDPQTLFNNVRNRVFQFCLEYGYYDFEKTVLGVYSQIPINNLQCDGTVSDAYNYINVDFNDDQIPLETTLVTLKDVAVLAKEGNTATFREVIRISPCDFLNYNYTTQEWFCSYDFYNNIQSTVTTNNPERLESGVPIRANDEVYNKDRIVVGGVELGRNNVDCAEADYTITIDDTPQPKLYKISGLIRIFNPLMDNASNVPDQTTQPNILERTGGIFYDTDTNTNPTEANPVYPFFGGSFYKNSNFVLKSDWACNIFKQVLPEGGFPVYAAGTKYFTVSKQVQRNGLTQRDDGSIDVSTDDQFDQAEAFYNNRGSSPSDAQQMYSTFEMLVPNGEYVIRVASHWCSFGDKLGRGYMYDLNNDTTFHQTSTFIWGVGDYRRGYQYDYEIKVTVSGADVFIGEFIVADLVTGYRVDPSIPTPDGVPWTCYSGYLIDQNGVVDLESLSKGIRVEKAYLQVNNLVGTPISYGRKFSDHNGYFYFGFLTSNLAIGDIVAYQVGGIMHTAGSIVYMATMGGFEQPSSVSVDQQSALIKLQEQIISPSDFIYSPLSLGGNLYGELILPCNQPQRRGDSSTIIEGSIVDADGNPVSGALLVYQHGRYTYSDVNGDYEIFAWGDMRTAPLSNPSISDKNRITDRLIFNGQVFCVPTYPNGQEELILITLFGVNTIPNSAPPYSPTARYFVSDFVVIELNNPHQKKLKRGGSYLVGVRYNDEQGRLCSVASWFELYIPFETEDLGKYPKVVDSNGNTYPIGTYRGGKPTINWTLNYSPPEYASDMQIVLTKNLFQKPSYLQWVINSVTYLSAIQTEATPEIETSFQNQNAIAVKLSISNIIQYSANNPGSQIGFTYNVGDRLRPIYDRGLNLLEGLQDFEIISFDAQTSSVIIKNFAKSKEIQSGYVVEIYNPQTIDSSESQIYYEVGEVFPCTNPNSPNNEHSVVSGTFTCGDTYWRGRNILVNDDKDNFGANYPVIIESASVSDFFTSQVSDIGRIGTIDPNFKQLFYPSRLIVSDQFQQDSAYNGLSSFSALNTKDEGRQYGEVSRLIMKGKTLHAIMKNNNVSNYIGVVTFRYAQSTQGVQAIADDYLGTQEPSLSNIGTQHPASVVIYDGYIYGLSDLRKSVWRHATDGMNEISRNAYTDAFGTARTRMVNYFKGLCEEGVWDAISVYDKRYREYILTVWKTATANSVFINGIEQTGVGILATVRVNSVVPINDGDVISVTYVNSVTGEKLTKEVSATKVTYLPTIPQSTNIQFYIPEGEIARSSEVIIRYKGEGKTIAWNEEKNGWTSEYSFLPETYGSLGDEIVSFVDGKIWLHDKNTIHNNFYGVQYETIITPVFNDESNNVKVWNALWAMMYQDDNRCNFYSDRVSNNNGQLSRLKAPNFVKKEEFWFTEFKGDLNDTTVNNPIINGRRMRSTALEVELKNDHTGEINMYGWRVNWTNSERTSK